MSIRDLCAKCGISYYTYRARLKSGMDFFDALTKPVRDYRQNPTASRAQGVFYVPSTPCKACGTSKRYTKSRNCVFCASDKSRDKCCKNKADNSRKALGFKRKVKQLSDKEVDFLLTPIDGLPYVM